MNKIIYSSLSLILLLFFIELSSFSLPKPGEERSTYSVSSWVIPDHLTFAGERVPLEDIDVKERYDRELLVNTFWHSHTFLNIKRANRWFEIIEPILEKNGIPNDFKYLAVVESGLDNNAVSPAGARGMWQFMPETGKKYNLEINSEVDERYHTEKATQAACDYLNDSYALLHNWTLSAASYNAGVGRIQRVLKKQKVDSYYDLYLNTETARFVYRLLAVKEVLSNSKDYGFLYDSESLYPPYKTIDVVIDTAIESLPDFAGEYNTTYKQLKLLNPWLRNTFLTNKQEKEYHIKVPIK